MATARKIEIGRIWYPGFLPEDSAALESDYAPVIVVADGERFELIDGYHRLAAAIVSERRTIHAIVVDAAEYALLETTTEDEWIEQMQEAA